MKRFISGLVLGLLIGTVITGAWAAMSGSLTDRKFDSYVEDSSGNTCLLVTIVP
jgi:4-hydroxybenzoate polyprenyltransferase